MPKTSHHLAALLNRLTCGWVFMNSGWGKLHRLDDIVAFFAQLGIPWPHLQAPMVACLEAVGGLLVLIGCLTRFISLPLMATMVVALATAKRADIEEWQDILGLSEFLFIVLFAQLALTGAGAWSLDAWWAKRHPRRNSLPVP